MKSVKPNKSEINNISDQGNTDKPQISPIPISRIATRKNLVYRFDDTDIAIAENFLSAEGKKRLEFYHSKKYRLKDEDISYRILNHWEKQGLLSAYRPDGKGWRLYSLVDLVWLRVIYKLRMMGYPLEKISKVCEDLNIHNINKAQKQPPFFIFYLLSALGMKLPVYLIVFENGEAEPLFYQEYMFTLKAFSLQNHIVINLNDILHQLFPKIDSTPRFDASLDLSAEELELIAMIRFGDYESIDIIMNDGKIERFELTESVDVKNRIIDILKKHAYQDIHIKQINGKTIQINRTIKIKA